MTYVSFTLEYARSDDFAEINTDRDSYVIGDEMTVRIPLVTEHGEADWIIDGANNPSDIAKRIQVS